MLLAAAAILVVGAVVLCWLSVRRSTQLRVLQAQVQQLNARQQAVPLLVQDLLVYSKTHRDIVPILESAGITNRTESTGK